MRKKVVIALNTAWNLLNFRSGLIRALVARGYDVVAVAPDDAYAARLAETGCRFVPLPMDNKGTHPGRDLLLAWRFLRLLRRERPHAFLGYTIKPNVYGSLASHALGIPVINNISGLGTAFVRDTWLTRVARALYRMALGRSKTVFFQNADDRELFVQGGLVAREKTELVPGSGIDAAHFAYAPAADDDGHRAFRFLLIARMLRDKGVGEYVEAAASLKPRYPRAQFGLLGFLDAKNPSAISRAQMEEWEAQGAVGYSGTTDDVRPFIAAADCVVLPSYREGAPRTLLEAAAIGRPIVATDTAGCRDVVDDGRTGFLCQVRDAADLAQKMERVLLMSPEARQAMGLRGREKVQREFDERIVIDKYLVALDRVVMQGAP